MTGFITAEGTVVPAGTDPWNLVADLRTMANSQRTIVPVANRAAATTITSGMTTDGRTPTATNPLIVYRADTDQLETYDGTNWYGADGSNTDHVAWTSLTLVNSWLAYVGGGGYYSGLRYRIRNDRIEVNGMIKSGATGSVITTLPTKPAFTFQITNSVNSSHTYNDLTVSGADGSITYTTGTSAPSFLSVDFFVPLS